MAPSWLAPSLYIPLSWGGLTMSHTQVSFPAPKGASLTINGVKYPYHLVRTPIYTPSTILVPVLVPENISNYHQNREINPKSYTINVWYDGTKTISQKY